MDDLPPPVKLTPDTPGDEPLFEARVNNPFGKFFSWIKQWLKKQSSITVKIPALVVIVAISSLGTGFGAYRLGFNEAASKFFPDSSPVLHRAISIEGLVEKSSSGKFYLKSGGNYTWVLKPVNPVLNLVDYVGKQATVKGNLTREKSVIEVSEVIASELPAIPSTPEVSQPTLNSNEMSSSGPDLYPDLQWETTQKKVLIFTSGKRKIEQEGVYLESAQVSAFPQDFINYYIEALKGQDFKETLNSVSPEGITVTYAKDDLFLTFGIKNIYKGSGSNKQLSGYKAFIEHN